MLLLIGIILCINGSPCRWVDGALTTLALPDGAICETETGIAVSGKVYVMGTYWLNSKCYPCAWADGARTDVTLPEGEIAGRVNGIYISE